MIDSHCHLNYPELTPLADVLNRARRNGVKGFLTINTRLDQAQDVIDIAHAHRDVACTIGVHPHEAHHHMGASLSTLLSNTPAPKDASSSLLDALTHFAHDARVVGIGETGLDYYYNHSPKEAQLQSFAHHIHIARMLDKPLVIHTREADADTIRVLDDVQSGNWAWNESVASRIVIEQSKHNLGPARGVFHCFSGTMDLCKHALDRGFYISLSGIVTFKKAENVHDVARYVPLDRLLIETDAPYLAPIPHRGQTNEPAFVVHTAERIADLRGITVSKVCDATTENFFTLFKGAQFLLH